MQAHESLESNWPPKSPYEAILSSPSGRRKLRSREAGLKDLTSPTRRFHISKSVDLSSANATKSPSDEEEDEETLQLQLEAIKAKLKLKKLQGNKAALHANQPIPQDRDACSQPDPPDGLFLPEKKAIFPKKDTGGTNPGGDVQVPSSPNKKFAGIVSSTQRSPSRVLLGIDKGLSAQNISLQRVPSERRRLHGVSNSIVRTSSSHLESSTHMSSQRIPKNRASTPARSFSIKMGEAREKASREQSQRERLAKMREMRSSAFSVNIEELGALRQAATSSERQVEVGSQRTKKSSVTLDPTSTLEKPRKIQSDRKDSSDCSQSFQNSRYKHGPDPPLTLIKADDTASTSDHAANSGDPSAEGASLFEPHSGCNLSRRILPHTYLERTFENKRTVVIPDLLRMVQAPEFLVPDKLVEHDFILLALVASKSSPIEHKQQARSKFNEPMTSVAEAQKSMKNENGKYMVFTLTDLKWTLDLFLFGPAFVRFRKLTPGTLIAILNPDIMPPPKHLADTGRWSLKLSSAEETVLEIGTSKDLAWCKSVKKDGQLCNAWVDRRHTEFCEFHTNLGVEKLRSGRMEVQGMSVPFGPGGRQSSFDPSVGRFKSTSGHSGRKGSEGKRGGGVSGNGSKYDREAHTTYFVAPGIDRNLNAAALIDADDFNIRGGKQARQREIREIKQKERAIAESLGLKGNGAGADYLRSLQNSKESVSGIESHCSAVQTESLNAKSLGLAGNTANSILLSPLKRKRCGEDRVLSKKKTRFVTAKGIKEAGRDSINANDIPTGEVSTWDEDDGLEII